MKKALLVIHTPPPYGGGEVQAQHMKDYFTKNPDFFIFDYSRKSHDRANWNKIQLTTVLHGIVWIFKVSFYIIKYRPSKVYFTLPKSYLAFIRNMTVLPLAHILNIKIFGELPGTSFLFLQDETSIKYKTGLFLLRRLDEIRFLSNSIALMHEKYRLKCPIVIDNGIDIPQNTAVPLDVFYQNPLPLVYIGAIESLKGIFNALQATKLCHDQGIKIHFHFIGYWIHEAEKKEALSYIEKYALNDFITFHGIKTGKEKWDILSNCAILVHPTYWDGVPLTILEALALGITVISTSVGGIPDTIKNNINGTILLKNSPDDLTQAIAKYYYNRDLLTEISKINKALFFKRYQLKTFIKNMEHWFNS